MIAEYCQGVFFGKKTSWIPKKLSNRVILGLMIDKSPK